MFGRTLFNTSLKAMCDGFQGMRAHPLRKFICRHRRLSFPPSRLRISEEVQSALANGRPVVALETAVLTHGLPPPHNLDCAIAVEGCIRGQGALPATVGMLDGKLVVGLSPAELARLAEASDKKEALKISRRDVAAGLAQGAAGGTTVSGTMLAANLAGISVFVTGGIGGVHRGGEQTFDISADLTELGRTPVAVVCAGCKSILDIERTLEYLETQGVPTIVLNNGLSFPAFFVADSGFKGSHSVKTAQEVAQILNESISLGLDSGLVVGVPIPREAAAEGQLVEDAIRHALDEAEKASVTGSRITPFLLSRVNELTEGKSLAANLALIKNNAAVGAVVAKELSELRRSTCSNDGKDSSCLPGRHSWKKDSQQADVIDRDQKSSSSNMGAEALQEEIDQEFQRLAGQPTYETNETSLPHQSRGTASCDHTDTPVRHYHTAASSSRQMLTLIHHPFSVQFPTTSMIQRNLSGDFSMCMCHLAQAAKANITPVQHPLSGLRFYLSGSPEMKEEACQEVESRGGMVVERISSGIDYIVDCGGEAGADELVSCAHTRSVVVINKLLLHHLTRSAGEESTLINIEKDSLSQALQRDNRLLVGKVQQMAKWWDIQLHSGVSDSKFAIYEAARNLILAIKHICCPFIGGGLLSDTKLEQESGQLPRDMVKTAAESGLVIVGAAISDLVARATDGNIQLNTTNPSTLSRAFGGVGRNVAEATIRFGTQPLFLSAVGDFIHHDLLRHWRKTLHADSCGIRVVSGEQTAVYVAVLHESGQLHSGLGSFDVLRYISLEWLSKFQKELVSAKVVCFDGNLSTDVIAHMLNMCGTARVPVWFEPTDTGKAKKPFTSSAWRHISLASPNLFELQSMANAAAEAESYDTFPEQVKALSAPSSNLNIFDKLQLCKRLAPLLLGHIPWLLVTLGYHGTLLVTSQPMAADQPWLDQLRTRHTPSEESNAVWIDILPSKKTQSIVSVSGAGDSLAGAALAGIMQGWSISDCVSSGLWAAQLSLSTVLPVSPEISRKNFIVQCSSSPSDFLNIHTGWTDIMATASTLG